MPEKGPLDTAAGQGHGARAAAGDGRDHTMKDGASDRMAVLDRFTGSNVANTLARLEREARGRTAEHWDEFLGRAHATPEAWAVAGALKRMAGQVHVTIHALGILRCLPHILEPGEEVESLSLGAGSGGKPFDLETNRRVAEFKFIRWTGRDSDRQNQTFKDFFMLEQHETSKGKHLYVLGRERAVKFLQGRRKLDSVLSGNKVRETFRTRFPNRFRTVGEYYAAFADKVEITDVSTWLDGRESIDDRGPRDA